MNKKISVTLHYKVLYEMKNIQEERLRDLREIRQLMERSSRFIGLSGLSGVAAGLCALGGAAAGYWFLDLQPFDFSPSEPYYVRAAAGVHRGDWTLYTFLVCNALITATLATVFAAYFTIRRARRKGQSIFDRTTLRLIVHWGVPMLAGAVFCLAMLRHNVLEFIIPATLIFYGLSLVSASKFTLPDVFYLGLCEVGLGFLAMLFLDYGLECWVLGFGILHIFYGFLMYLKYERTENRLQQAEKL